MSRFIGITAGLLAILGILDALLATVGDALTHAGGQLSPDGGAGALVLLFISGTLMQWRDRRY